MMAIDQQLSPGIGGNMIGEETRILRFTGTRIGDTTRCQNLTTKYIDHTFLHIDAHLMIVDQMWSTNLTGIIADLQPNPFSGIEQEEITLNVFDGAYRIVQITTQHKYILRHGIIDHLVTGTWCWSIIEFSVLAQQRPGIGVHFVHPHVTEILEAIPAAMQIDETSFAVHHQLMATTVAYNN